MDTKLLLFDINTEVCEEFSNFFKTFPNVEVQNCSLDELGEYACIVSPANSFGLMDGGIDRYITAKFGSQLMDRVQQYVLSNYAGEQPIGTSFIIGTGDSEHPYLAHTPTMRVPMDISNTDNVYYAMKAMLNEVNKYNENFNNPIKTIACSGMGTYTGLVSPKRAALQMSLAYHHVLNIPKFIDWEYASVRNCEILSVID